MTRDDYASAWMRKPMYVTLQGPMMLEVHNSAWVTSTIGSGTCMECLFPKNELVE